jgi:hypothetical protein
MKDFLGNTISTGSWVAYPHHSGSSLYMQVGYITEATSEHTKVRKVENHWRTNDARVGKESVMKRPDRAVVLSRETIPAAFLEVVKGLQ